MCPVTTPICITLKKIPQPISDAPKNRKVYLPSGASWFDFWSEEIFEGGQTITATAPLETLPLFCPREAPLLPMTEPKQFVDEKLNALYEIHIYRGADGTFTLYEDTCGRQL